MSEFIGSRISLISKSDIRYVGTLHEINSENSTVALENVTSFGTEGRRSSPEEEIAPSDSVYEYIVFRGSDVKDLRIEEAPKENKPPPPQIPNDPAILGSGVRPPNQNRGQHNGPQPPHQQGPDGFRQQPPPFQQPHQFQYHPYAQGAPQRFEGPPGGQQNFRGPPGGFQGHPGMMPYGGPPPGWYPPPGQGFPNQPPGPFSPPPHIPFGRPPNEPPSAEQQRPHEASEKRVDSAPNSKQISTDTPPNNKTILQRPGPDTATPSQDLSSDASKAPTLPTSTKPNVGTAAATTDAPKNNTAAAKSGRIVPAVPLASPTNRNIVQPIASFTPPTSSQTSGLQTKQESPIGNAAQQYQNTTEAAAAAVAAAMAKLPPGPGKANKPVENGEVMDNLTRKVNEMRTDERNRQPRSAIPSGPARGGRGGRRGGRDPAKAMEVPTTEFDFASSNARFNKDDISKEAAGASNADGEALAVDGASPAETPSSDVVVPPAAPYSKASFFDNISSEARDREESSNVGARRASGQEFRGEERRRNMETFGMGSVDGGYRGGMRGRGRGRGGYRGRGESRGGVRGGSGYRGARGGFQAQTGTDA